MLGGWLLYVRQLLGRGGGPLPPVPPADPRPIVASSVVHVPVATSRVLGVAVVGSRVVGACVARSEVVALPVVRLRGSCPC